MKISTCVGDFIETYNQCISYYLMSSFLYYHMPFKAPLLTDENFDKVCKELLQLPDTNDHPHKHLIDKGALEAGTGFHLKVEDYPRITVHSSLDLCRKIEENL